MKPMERLKARFGTQPNETGRSYLKRLARYNEKGHDEPYADGCTHNVQWRASNGQTKNWNRPFPIVIQNVEVKASTIGKAVSKGGTDPCAWLDLKYRVTWDLITAHRDKPLHINTRSDLIGHEAYLSVLNPKKHSVTMHLFGGDADLKRCLEPGAPSNQRRLDAVKALVEDGIQVHVVIDDVTWNFNIPASKRNRDIKALQKEIAALGVVTISMNSYKLDDRAYKRCLPFVADYLRKTPRGRAQALGWKVIQGGAK